MSDTRSSRRRGRWLRRAILWTAFAIALIFAAIQGLLPWLARTGNLNAIVAGIVKSSLTVDVSIEKIETEPLSELTVSRLRSVSAEAKERLGFSAGFITIRYDPLELLGGRVRDLVVSEPEIFINLDADLEGLARAPEVPGAARRELPEASSQWIPVQLDQALIERGSLTLRFGGRDLLLRGFRLSASRVGRALGQHFDLSAEALGGVVRAWGGIDVVREPDKPARFVFHGASVAIDGVDAATLADWLAGDDALGAWLRTGAVRARGRLRLEGSLEGTWPEEVRLDLATHAQSLSASFGDDVSMDAADVGLRIRASATGDLDVVRFEVSTQGAGLVAAGGEGKSEGGSVEVAGELRRHEAEGTLLLERAVLQLEGVGGLSVSGRVLSLLGEKPPAFDLAIESPSIDLGSVLERLRRSRWSGAFASPALESWSGDVRLEGKVGGDADRPRAEGSFEVRRLFVPTGPSRRIETGLRGSFSGFEVALDQGAVRIDSADVEIDLMPASALAEGFLPSAPGLQLDGDISVAVSACEVAYPIPEGGITVDARIAWRDGALSAAGGSIGATGVSLRAEAKTDWSGARRELAFDLGVEGRAKEVLAGRYYAELSGGPLSFSASGKVLWNEEHRVEGLTVERANAETPVTGPITARGECIRDDSGRFRLDAHAEALDVPGAEAFRVFVRDPLSAAVPFLEGASLEGRAALEVHVTGPLGGPTVVGGVAVGPADLAMATVKVLGLEARAPFELGPKSPGAVGGPVLGFARARGLDFGSWSIEGVDFPFLLARRTYSFSPATLLLHGGWVEVSDASFTLEGPRGARATATVRARGVDLARLTRAHRLPEVAGALELDLSPVTLDGRRVDAHGELTLRAFGGTLSFSNLTLENAAKPYSDLRLGSGRIEGLHMADLGRVYHFGVMSGVLEGEVHGLELTAGEVTAFEGRLRSVPTSGVPQFLNRGAIESLRRVFEGPLGALEETFFSHFRFADFGFWCRLKDGVFRLRGDFEEGGVEYILRGRWYQFPRISIINGRPGLPYDWNTIVSNLRSIYEKR